MKEKEKRKEGDKKSKVLLWFRKKESIERKKTKKKYNIGGAKMTVEMKQRSLTMENLRITNKKGRKDKRNNDSKNGKKKLSQKFRLEPFGNKAI